MAQNYTWPSVSVTATNPSVGTNGSPAPTSSTLVAGQNPSNNTQPLKTDASGNLKVDISSASGAPIATNATIVSPLASGRVVIDGSQVTQPISAASLPLPTGAATEATLSSLNGKVVHVDTGAVVVSSSALPTGAATEATLTTRASETTLSSLNGKVTTVDTSNVTITSSTLPTGASTSALQTTGNTSLSSIDTKTPALVSGRVPVDGSGVTQPISAASLPLPTGAATEATIATRLTGSLVPTAYNEIDLSYTGSDITTVVYKLAGSTVKTLTLTYSGGLLSTVVAS